MLRSLLARTKSAQHVQDAKFPWPKTLCGRDGNKSQNQASTESSGAPGDQPIARSVTVPPLLKQTANGTPNRLYYTYCCWVIQTWSNTSPLCADIVACNHLSGYHLASPIEQF